MDLESVFDHVYLCTYVSARVFSFSFFFFNDTATTDIYTLSLHDALPILRQAKLGNDMETVAVRFVCINDDTGREAGGGDGKRSEEHTSELQSHHDLVCRLLLEKKKRVPWLRQHRTNL